jgi:flagellar protein FlgJ
MVLEAREMTMNKMTNSRMGQAASIAGVGQGALPPAALQSLLAAMERASSVQRSTSQETGGVGRIDQKAMTPREFAQTMWPHAVAASRATGIPPQFLIAHAALESGWGQRDIKNADGSSSCNLFGIKAQPGWRGKTASVMTTEYVDGVAVKETASFRAYDSYAEAFADYARLLSENPRYSAVIGSHSGTEFAKRLQQAGYATDPQYAEKLAAIIDGPALRQALIG